ncbi:uncharacterized protein [Pleurodeles waltl]|uniref:uncharacterized protein n=1 Tax=Pleurodeles waltl TaxID=8319 RepID=UPI00370954F7
MAEKHLELKDGSDAIFPVQSTSTAEDACRVDLMEVQKEVVLATIPTLSEKEKYHVFISFSSLDTSWVLDLVDKLEATGLKVCYHGRDFVPGKLIIENMVESIERSQKTLMVLSPDFVQSGWCLFEANLSLLKDCMERKPIVPVMLKPCPVPLHLNHLTYVEADDSQFFRKLLQVLCTSNHQLRHSIMVPYQPSALYNGKTLLTLNAIKEDIPNWKTGTFSTAPVPDPLRMLIEDPAIYQAAIQAINTTPANRSCIQDLSCRVFLGVTLVILAPLFILGYIALYFYLKTIHGFPDHSLSDVRPLISMLPFLLIGCILLPVTFLSVCRWGKRTEKHNHLLMAQRTGHANDLLMGTSVLIGCESRVKLHFVYVSLEECKQTFKDTFRGGLISADEMFRRAIVYFSSNYACCVAKKHFPFYDEAPIPGHLDCGVCFCQYVSLRLKQGSWF